MLKKILGLFLMCALLFSVAVSFASCDLLKKPDDGVTDETPDDGGTTPDNPDDGGSTPEAPVGVLHTITVVDAAGNAVAGARVKLIPAEGDAVEKTTDAEGKITASLAGEWKAQLLSVPAEYYATAAQLAEQLSFTDAAITITVENATYMFTVKGADGTTYPGATVTVSADGEVIVTAITDENGVCYVYVADGKANYTVNCELADANGYSVMESETDSETFSYELEVIDPVGFESNPHYPQDDVNDGDEFVITVPAGTSYYLMYVLSDAVNLTVNGDVSLVIEGETIDAIAGKIEYLIDADPDPNDSAGRAKVPCAIVNNGTEDVEVTMTWLALLGSRGNPIKLEAGDGSVDIEAEQSVFFEFTADTNYIFTVTYSANAVLGAQVGNWPEDEITNPVTIKVYEGKTASFSLGLVDDTTAGTVTYSITLEEFIPVPDGSIDAPFVISENETYTVNVQYLPIYYVYTAPYRCTVKISTENSNASVIDDAWIPLINGAGDITLEMELGDRLVFGVGTHNWMATIVDFDFESTKYVCPGLHAWDEGVITVPATCANPGVKTYSCLECGVIQTEELDVAPHNVIDVAARDASCTEIGYTAHKACTECDYAEGKVVSPALGHICTDWQTGVPVTCLENGVDVGFCDRCESEIERVVYAQGHKYVHSSDARDGTYEFAVCSGCSCRRLWEKNTVIDFSNGAVVDENNKLSVTPGEEGRLKVSVEDGVLKLVADATKYTCEAGNPDLTVLHTDVLHDKSTSENGGQYLVFECDVKLGRGDTNRALAAFVFNLKDENGNGGLTIPVAAYSSMVVLNDEILDPEEYVADDENGTWISLRLVAELAIEKEEGVYVSYYTLYYKHRDIYEPMQQAGERVRLESGYTGHVGRTDVYRMRLAQIYEYPSQTYWLDNISFIRTADTNYLYTDCVHEFSEWSDATCKDNGKVTRHCTVKGCEYVDTEYLASLTHTQGDTVEAKAPTCTEAGHTAYYICSVCKEKVGYEYLPELPHTLTEWTVVDRDQKRTCTSGCGYYEIRDNGDIVTATFDDGTINGCDKFNFSEGVQFVDEKTLTTDNGYVDYVINSEAPGKAGDNVLKITHDGSKFVSGGAPRAEYYCSGGVNEGDSHVYTLEFDTCIMPRVSTSLLPVFEVEFAGVKEGISTAGANIRTASGGSVVVGKAETWISLKFVYVVSKDGEADCTIYYKDAAESEYKTLVSKVIKNEAIMVGGVDFVTFIGYSSGSDATYYFDNILFTCHTVGVEAE